VSGRILLVPSVAKGNGSGHLVRCLSLARSLGPGAAVFVPETKSETSWSAADLSMAYARELAGVQLVSSLRGDDRSATGAPEPRPRWDLVVLDRRATSLEELAFWERFGPVLAIDEGGPAREAAHYLVDILPRAAGRRESRSPGSNKACLGFLDLPRNRRRCTCPYTGAQAEKDHKHGAHESDSCKSIGSQPCDPDCIYYIVAGHQEHGDDQRC